MNADVVDRNGFSIAYTANDGRARYLKAALERQCRAVTEVEFDQIDPATRMLAGALTFRPDRSEWWTMYHLHSLVARRRRKVLHRNLAERPGHLDGLIMWGSWFNARLRGIPVIHYIDQSLAVEPVLGETRPRYINRRAAHRLQARTYEDAAAVLCLSNWAREQTLMAYPNLNPSKVQGIGWGPCGMDLSSEEINWDAREPLVLHVSNDFHRKGLDYVVETAARVRAVVPNATFVVVGADYGGMKNVPTGPGVIFTGRINDRATLENYFRRASVFFLPHRFDRSPHVLVEAMSAGLPIVTSAQGGPQELAGNTGAGFTIPIGDVDGYARAITTLLQSRETAARMGDIGKQLMQRSYTWDAVATKILEVLKTCRSGHRAPERATALI